METNLTIGEVAAQSGMSAHTLRYYERIGLIHAVGRDAGGRRRYAAGDLEWIRFLLRLRDTGMAINDMLLYARLRREGTDTVAKRRYLLEGHLEKLNHQIARLQELAGFVADKIEIYRGMERSSLHSSKSGDAHHDASSTKPLRTRARKAAGD